MSEDRVEYATTRLKTLVTCTPGVLGGRACLAGTRFPFAQVFAEIANGDSVAELADNYDLDEQQIVDAIHCYAILVEEGIFTLEHIEQLTKP